MVARKKLNEATLNDTDEHHGDPDHHDDDIDLTVPPELDRRLTGGVAEPDEQAPAMGVAAPPIKTEDQIKDEATIVAEGRKAWERRKAEVRASWQDWVLFGKAIRVGHEEAKRKADGKNGKKYAAAFHQWLKANGFFDVDKFMDKDDRAKLIWLVNRLPEIEALRATWSEVERARRNHPYTIYMVAHCGDRGLPEFRSEKSGEPSSNGNGAAQPDDDGGHQEDGAHPKKKKKNNWDPGQLMLAANKAMGLVAGLKLKGGWPSDEPPDRGLVEAWWEAAWAFTNIANVLDEASGLSGENLPLKIRSRRELAASCFLTKEEQAERPPLT